MDVWSWKDFVAGWAGGVAGLVVGHPADTIKVRQQAFPEGHGALKTLHTTLKYEGITGLYKGLSFPLVSAGALNALFFGVYANTLRCLEQFRSGDEEYKACSTNSQIQSDFRHSQWLANVFLSGCAGGIAATMIACPVELIKIQMQSQTGVPAGKGWGAHYEPQHRGVLDCIRRLTHRRGVRGLYTGLYPMLLRDVLSYGVYMLVYESGVRNSSGNHVLTTLASGGTAGAVSWALIIPLDVVKSRIQADNIEKPMYKGIVDCIKKSYHRHGLSVFFRGFSMIMLRAFPVNAATFVMYEWSLQVLGPNTKNPKPFK